MDEGYAEEYEGVEMWRLGWMVVLVFAFGVPVVMVLLGVAVVPPSDDALESVEWVREPMLGRLVIMPV